ncbi:hypothetical protein [Alloyangia mangrovi]|nr:hypothetical protein [Alloyangia mangrovi]
MPSIRVPVFELTTAGAVRAAKGDADALVIGLGEGDQGAATEI